MSKRISSTNLATLVGLLSLSASTMAVVEPSPGSCVKPRVAAHASEERVTKAFGVDSPISEVKAILGPPFECQWHGCGIGTFYTWYLPDGCEVRVHSWDFVELETVESIYVKRPGEQGQGLQVMTVSQAYAP